MRLWHIDLLEVLPRQQLLSQWRECCCIARNISVNGTPNHLLVNKILDYDLSDFYSYSILVSNEMLRRGYKVDRSKFEKYCKCDRFISRPFEGWHNDRYFLQCFYNLQEKYDCGGMTELEWCKIEVKYYHKGGKL
jgi:uncharacterized protein (TIGR02328 family)